MIKFFYFLLLVPTLSWGQEILLDKIVAVINNRVITLSELNRQRETVLARREISPFMYTETSYKDTELLQIVINIQIVREKISAQGYVITDDNVESRIKLTEEKLGLTRSALLEFLKQKGITYEEYFEVIREAMEYNIFSTRIIAPLITITEQELKNEYYSRNSSNRALSFKYNLVDFSISEKLFPGKDYSSFTTILKDYQLTGRLPEAFKDLETSALDELTEDGLNADLAKGLQTTNEGQFTRPTVIGESVHVFYVKKKDLEESQAFLKHKEQLQNEIFAVKSKSLTKNWFEREYANYYIKKFL